MSTDNSITWQLPHMLSSSSSVTNSQKSTPNNEQAAADVTSNCTKFYLNTTMPQAAVATTPEIPSKSHHHHLFFKGAKSSTQNATTNEPKPLHQNYPSLQNQYVPAFVDFCVGMIEKNGLDFVGIYRVPGNNTSVSALQRRFDSIQNSYDIQLKAPADPNTRCDIAAYTSALKLFFRTLPDPLIPLDSYEALLLANRQTANRDRMTALKRLLQQLPRWNHETLRFLVAHLHLLSTHSEHNKMDIQNLAIIFGPTLMRKPSSDCLPAGSTTAAAHFSKRSTVPGSVEANRSAAADALDQCSIVQTLITHHLWFFDGAIATDNVPEDSSHKSSLNGGASTGLHLVFSRLNTSLSVNKSVDGDSASSPERSPSPSLMNGSPRANNRFRQLEHDSPTLSGKVYGNSSKQASQSSPLLKVPAVKSLVKSAPDIPAEVEQQQNMSQKDYLTQQQHQQQHASRSTTKSAFTRKLKQVRNIFRKTASINNPAYDDNSNNDDVDEVRGGGKRVTSLSLSINSANSSKLNSFDKSPPLSAHPTYMSGSSSPSRSRAANLFFPSPSSSLTSPVSELASASASAVMAMTGTTPAPAPEPIPPQVPPRKNSAFLLSPPISQNSSG